MKTYIVEHPTRGVLKEMDGTDPHFSPTMLRREAWQFPDFEGARKAIRKMPDSISAACHIRVSPKWDVVG